MLLNDSSGKKSSFVNEHAGYLLRVIPDAPPPLVSVPPPIFGLNLQNWNMHSFFIWTLSQIRSFRYLDPEKPNTTLKNLLKQEINWQNRRWSSWSWSNTIEETKSYSQNLLYSNIKSQNTNSGVIELVCTCLWREVVYEPEFRDHRRAGMVRKQWSNTGCAALTCSVSDSLCKHWFYKNTLDSPDSMGWIFIIQEIFFYLGEKIFRIDFGYEILS